MERDKLNLNRSTWEIRRSSEKISRFLNLNHKYLSQPYIKSIILLRDEGENKQNMLIFVKGCSSLIRPVKWVTLWWFLFGLHPYQPTLDFAFFILEWHMILHQERELPNEAIKLYYRTSHSFKENQPMHRRRNFLKENLNENSWKLLKWLHCTTQFLVTLVWELFLGNLGSLISKIALVFAYHVNFSLHGIPSHLWERYISSWLYRGQTGKNAQILLAMVSKCSSS